MTTEELRTITDVIVKNVAPSEIGDALFSVMKISKQSYINDESNNSLLNSEKIFFTKKEIDKMPEYFKKEFRTDGCTAHIYKRKNSTHAFVYDIKYRRNGYNVCITDSLLERAKERFIEALRVAQPVPKKIKGIPRTFYSFTIYYCENFRKGKVSDQTYKCDLGRINKYLKPLFNETPLYKITSKECQDLINDLTSKGLGKTADEIYSLLSIIFKGAMNHNILTINPLKIVYHTKHDRQHGTALTKEEEQRLKDYFKRSSYLNTFMLALYTGLRPNEYKTVQIKDDMIIAENSKRKNKKIEYKRIPICDMLKHYIGNNFKAANVENLRIKFKECFPNHKLYDLRTTFYSRCKECGLELYAIQEYMGHSLGAVGNSYTDLSDEYLKKEMKKLNY